MSSFRAEVAAEPNQTAKKKSWFSDAQNEFTQKDAPKVEKYT